MGIQAVLVSAPNEETASHIAKTLVEENLAACVSIVPQMRSIYSWESKLCDEQESLMILKTDADTYPQLEKRIQELHPYSVPEILALDVAAGLNDYCTWVTQQTQNSKLRKQHTSETSED